MTAARAADSARPDLQRLLDAQLEILDAARPDAVARQRGRGRLTVREALDTLIDSGSWVEYGGLAKPAMAGMDGAADGLVMGTARVGGR
ncbi:MAG: biotin carboxylase, partial [Betaproteobacteria bacterium]|nr:biotin carboxylase [Betaproteobacteria bacterium]